MEGQEGKLSKPIGIFLPTTAEWEMKMLSKAEEGRDSTILEVFANQFCDLLRVKSPEPQGKPLFVVRAGSTRRVKVQRGLVSSEETSQEWLVEVG